ncbi:Dienelactone hydrolase family protein [Streptomyces prasinopilosus]|uniref:Dienelactone hydrolase family protein n=1 Tax=Streptomyces prasinopilosus TaxID=67344 RepID=A0A1G6X5I3_9ACTN|nr:Dienelactone hydrolase family protein [Streptomyces prasinopilosus]
MPTQTLRVPTTDGRADAFAAFPGHSERHPGVLTYPDGFGIRPVLREMARALAGRGYCVLVPNSCYRNGPSHSRNATGQPRSEDRRPGLPGADRRADGTDVRSGIRYVVRPRTTPRACRSGPGRGDAPTRPVCRSRWAGPGPAKVFVHATRRSGPLAQLRSSPGRARGPVLPNPGRRPLRRSGRRLVRVGPAPGELRT